MEEKVFSLIERRLPGFSKGKQQIGAYILQNPNEAPFQTAARIGKAVRISESTVVRFAVDLGFKGFPELQKALQQEVMSRLQTGEPLSPQRQGTDPEDSLSRWIDASRRSLEALFPLGESSSVREAVEVLDQCSGLYLLSDSQGQCILPYCKHLIRMVMEDTLVLSPRSREELFRDLSAIGPGDCLLAIAMGGGSRLFSFALEQAGKRGGKVLLITTDSREKAGEGADHTFLLPQGEGDLLPDLTGITAFLHGLFSLLGEKRARDLGTKKSQIEEIKNAYDKYESPAL